MTPLLTRWGGAAAVALACAYLLVARRRKEDLRIFLLQRTPLHHACRVILMNYRRHQARGAGELPPKANVSPRTTWRIVYSQLFGFHLLDLSRRYRKEGVYRVGLLFNDLYVVCDPALCRAFLTGERALDEKEPAIYSSVEADNNPRSILTMPTRGENYSVRRKGIARALGPSQVRAQAERGDEIAARAVRALRFLSRNPVRMDLFARRVAIDFLCNLTLGIDPDTCGIEALRDEKAPGGEFFERTHEASELLMQEGMAYRLRNPLRKYQIFAASQLAVDRAMAWKRHVVEIIETAHVQRRAEAKPASKCPFASPSGGHALSDTVLEGEGYRSRGERRSDLQTTFVGGTDSTSNTLALLLWELAKHQEHQEKVQEELDATCGDAPSVDGIRIPKRNSARRPFLALCIRETMRLWPVDTFGSFRVAETSGVALQCGDFIIPQRATVLVQFPAANFDESIFGPDPWDFNPYRWQAGDTAAMQAAFTPFSEGARSCPGRHVAAAELALVAAALLANFTFGTHTPPRMRTPLTTSATGVILRVTPRYTEDGGSSL